MTLAARFLPQSIAKPLFGDRKKFGTSPISDDVDWMNWQGEYLNFYHSTQKKGIGARVNDAGYKILNTIDFAGLHVGEIGPGSLPHHPFWRAEPAKFTAIDVNQDFLDMTEQKVSCPFEAIIVQPDQLTLPMADASLDILLSFYSLEHLNPLGSYLDEYARVLKPGGLIVGAVPNEGGLAWGLGRLLTSRRWIHANTQINYDKIICWEHPNFVDTILGELEARFEKKARSIFPYFGIPTQNFSLITRFAYQKR